MDPRRFDHLVRTLYTTDPSRRAFLRRGVAAALGSVATLFGVRQVAACTGRLCNTDSGCCAGTNCLNGGCNPCSARGATCSARRPCCRQTRTTCCGAICTDTRTSNAHCGRCGRACGRGSYCSNSICCPNGTVNRSGICCPFTHQNCSGQCKNLQSDRLNCGICGRACSANSICSRGKCCPNGRINCSGTCIDLRTNPNNCGQCGRRCPSGRCVNRTCKLQAT